MAAIVAFAGFRFALLPLYAQSSDPTAARQAELQ